MMHPTRAFSLFAAIAAATALMLLPAAAGAAPASTGVGYFSVQSFYQQSPCPSGSLASYSQSFLLAQGTRYADGTSNGEADYLTYGCNGGLQIEPITLTCVYVVQDTAYASGPDPNAAPGSYFLLKGVQGDKLDRSNSYGTQVVNSAPAANAQKCGADTVSANQLAAIVNVVSTKS